jgi:Tol biopolymer transport system component
MATRRPKEAATPSTAARRRRIATAGVLALLLAGCHAQRSAPAGTATAPRSTVSTTLPAARGLTGRIAYNGVDGDIWVMDADGRHRRQVTHSGPGGDFDPSWSPDGRRIVFRTSRGRHLPDSARLGLDGIFVVDADGLGETPIHPRTGGLFPDWSPDGSRIAFSGVLHRGDREDHLFVMRPDGSRVRVLNTRRVAECAEWSPDGSRIMFCSHWGAGWDVGVMDADGGNLRRLTDATGNDYPGAWSPDGRRIAFSSERDGQGEVWVMDADGNGQRRLTGDPATYDAPNSWLPDGRIVVASSREGEAVPAWFTMEPDGSRRRALPQLHGAQAPIDWLP